MAMRSTQQLNITLPNEMAELIRAKVAAGEYASESEVIRDGVCVLLAQDRALEHWLRTEVVAAYRESINDPSSLIGSEQVRARLAALHERTVKEQS
jgi:putative addiction module CopG family antidote